MKLSFQIEIDKALDLETPKRRVTVGRANDNDLVVAHNSISRNHCIIEEDREGNFHLTDLGSSNGSFINEKRVIPNKRTPIEGGYLTLGRVECEIRSSKQSNTQPGNIIHSGLAENGDATATIRISRLELNRPSLTLENEKKLSVKGPRNPISQHVDKEECKPIKKSKRGLLFTILVIILIAAWYLGDH